MGLPAVPPLSCGRMKKPHFWSSERLTLYGYFLGMILLGTLLLALPLSWAGGDGRRAVRFVDAFFTAVSAVCVTGLITVDTAGWTLVGQLVILVLIQFGGLGIITFSVLYLVIPRMRVSVKNTRIISENFTPVQGINPRSIIRSVVITTFFFEGIGAAILILAFTRSGTESPVINGVFHAVSAFCNAGFSRFSQGLVPYRDDLLVNLTIMILVIIGGLGFIVIRDIRRKLSDWRRPLLFHTRLMVIAVPILIIAGAVVFLLFDSTGTFSRLPWGRRIVAATFQSVTTRTAGFNTVEQSALDPDAQFLTTILMFVGGGSGSTAGGIKVSTAAILFLILFRGVDERGDIRLLKRRLVSADAVRAAMFFLKAAGLLFASVFILSAVEQATAEEYRFLDYFFESVSALGTVGLSLGLTPGLSAAGKIVVAATMFGGRVGLFSLIIRPIRDRTERLIDYPKGEVLIG